MVHVWPQSSTSDHLGFQNGVHLPEHFHVDFRHILPGPVQASDWCGTKTSHDDGHHGAVVAQV